MAIALSDEHQAQRLSARRWLDAHCPPTVPRALLDAEEETLQPVWKEMAAQGWLGIHLPEEFGGQGFGLFELAVLLEETGWSVVPGPLLPTVVTSALLAEASAGPSAATAAAVLPGLIDGSRPAALSLGDTSLDVVDHDGGGRLVVSGTLRPLLGAATASLVLAPGPPHRRRGDLVPARRGRVRRPGASVGTAQPGRHPPGGHGRGRRPGRAGRPPARGSDHPAAPTGGHGSHGRRACGRGPLVPGDRHRLCQGEGAVRSAHRTVPGGQAPSGRHGGAGRADDRGGLGRRGGRVGGRAG